MNVNSLIFFSNRISLIGYGLDLIKSFAKLNDQLVCFKEVFQVIAQLLGQLPTENYPDEIQVKTKQKLYNLLKANYFFFNRNQKNSKAKSGANKKHAERVWQPRERVSKEFEQKTSAK